MIRDICGLYGVNEEQARALDINESMALKAGAGSGKTRVLTKRFTRLLKENTEVSLNSIAAITFTDKAAAEMKDRIRRELSEWIAVTEDREEKRRLSNLRMRISEADINTIHGFCAQCLRDNFSFLGIDPAFGVMEQVDRNMRLSRIADEVITGFTEQQENERLVQVIGRNYGPSVFMGSLKQGLISAYTEMKEKGYMPSEFIKAEIKGEELGENPVYAVEIAAAGMIEEMDRLYTKFKQKENVLDFNDLEVLVLELLDNETVRESYYKRYTAIMVDEFQDVNSLQKEIIYRLAQKDGRIAPGRLFIVGDHKQSIYGFRGSDYRIFEEVCRDISASGKVEQLNSCYRSTREIIGGVNRIFENLLDPYEKMEFAGKSREGRKIELITWEAGIVKENKPITRWDAVKKLLGKDEGSEDLEAALEAEYENTAAVGKKEYQSGVIAGCIGKLRKDGYAYRDIAILLRSRASLGDIENALAKKGIPFCVLGGIGFWNRREINDLLYLYRLVFFPEDRLALFSVLRSPLFGFSDDLLLAFAMFIRKAGRLRLDELMSAFGSEAGSSERWLVERAAGILKELLPKDGIQNALELVKEIINTTGYVDILSALPEGELKLRNLEKLLRLVEDFEEKGIYTARELLDYLNTLEEASGMDEEASLDNEDSDAVKILTIHASKGLEFRAVLIPGMDSRLDGVSKRHKPFFFIDQDKNLTAIGLDEELKWDESANPAYSEFFREKLSKELEDSRRLLYVAATRAMDYLAFIGEKQEAAPDGLLESQNTFMKQLAYAINKAGTVDEIVLVDAASLITGEQIEGRSDGQQKAVMEMPAAEEENAGIEISEVIEEKDRLGMPVAEEEKSSIDTLAAMGQKTGMEMPAAIEENAVMDVPVQVVREDESGIPLRLLPCEADLSGSISISSWMKYRDCPRRFFLENIAGLQDEKEEEELDEAEASASIGSADFGTLVHAFLEKIDIEGIGSQGLIASGEAAAMLETELAEEDLQRFRKCINGFYSIEADRKNIPMGRLAASFREFAFRVPFAGGLNLTGFIDRVDVYEDGGKLKAVVIDYKTNKIKDRDKIREKSEYYAEQLLSYAWALEQLPFHLGGKVEVKEAVLYFLDFGKAVNVDLYSKRIEDTIASLRDSAPYLLGAKPMREYSCCPSEKCKWCNCRGFCRIFN